MKTIFNIGDDEYTTKNGHKVKYRDLDLRHIKKIIRNNPSRTFLVRDMQLELLRRAISKSLHTEI